MHWLSPLLLATVVFAGCRDLTGNWKNAKGSSLHIEQTKHQLHGTFRTMVEVSEGSAGVGAVHIRGWANDDMLSFAVKYPSSMVAFTGQCYEKNGNDTIHASWLLHSKQDTCDDHWTSTRVGQDKFVRVKSKNIWSDTNEDM